MASTLNNEFTIQVNNESVKVTFSNKNILGKGAFGIVYSGWMYLKTGEIEVAVKVFYEKAADTLTCNNTFWREMRSTSKLKHPNIIKIYGYNKERLSIVMEKASMSLDKCKIKDVKIKYKLAKDITLGLLYMHSLGFLHFDLHARNILIFGEGDNMRAVIGDLGIARFKENFLLTPGNYPIALPSERDSNGASYCNPLLGSSPADVNNLLQILFSFFAFNKTLLKKENWLQTLMDKYEIDHLSVETVDVMMEIEAAQAAMWPTVVESDYLNLENYLSPNYAHMLAIIPLQYFMDPGVYKLVMTYILYAEYPFDIRQAAKMALLSNFKEGLDGNPDREMLVAITRMVIMEARLEDLDFSIILEIMHHLFKLDPSGSVKWAIVHEIGVRKKKPLTPWESLLLGMLLQTTDGFTKDHLELFRLYLFHGCNHRRLDEILVRSIKTLTRKKELKSIDFASVEIKSAILSEFFLLIGLYGRLPDELEKDKFYIKTWLEYSLHQAPDPVAQVIVINVYSKFCHDYLDALDVVTDFLHERFPLPVRINATKAITIFCSKVQEANDIMVEVIYSHLSEIMLDQSEPEELRVQALRSLNNIAYRAMRKGQIEKDIRVLNCSPGSLLWMTVNDVKADLEGYS